MKFIKKFFNHDDTVIGLCSLRKKDKYIKINLPEDYKKTFIQNVETNFLLL